MENKMSPKEMAKAIKDYCHERNCYDCEFYRPKTEKCTIAHMDPEDWDISPSIAWKVDEIYHNCTVEILRRGDEISIGWWREGSYDDVE